MLMRDTFMQYVGTGTALALRFPLVMFFQNQSFRFVINTEQPYPCIDDVDVVKSTLWRLCPRSETTSTIRPGHAEDDTQVVLILPVRTC